MSNVMDTISTRNNQSEFKLYMVLTFVLVAISFFALGFMYANVPPMEILIPLVIIIAGVNASLVYYLCRMFARLSNT